LDALDRLTRLADRAPERTVYAREKDMQAADTIREALERLREERDEWERKAPVWTAQAVEPWQHRAEVTEVENQRLTEGLREKDEIIDCLLQRGYFDPFVPLAAFRKIVPKGAYSVTTADEERAWLAKIEARALLSANPPQGDTAAFCEHGYTTEDSAHPSAGLERCPTCSPSDGGGAK
jgi:hypothetical protein